ncbi:hypothetical protein B0H66DRAFT_617430 [Apodospora peruviana]|uniref:Uncharacterized protein n=1 Tax=Apodospora peruviana TaxID=516989 RepID=A0AAE0MCX9_9PEZI|nr:hypothetical protein B0H66DRAFT_617430 [Apodospora peruviana]
MTRFVSFKAENVGCLGPLVCQQPSRLMRWIPSVSAPSHERYHLPSGELLAAHHRDLDDKNPSSVQASPRDSLISPSVPSAARDVHSRPSSARAAAAVPDPGPSPDSSPTPSPSPDPDHPENELDVQPVSYRTGFWTPATIGGVPGGSAAGLILLAILVCWCRRCCCCGGGGGGSYIHRPRPQPLSSETIYWLVKDLDSPYTWQQLYTQEARRTHTKYGPNNVDVDPTAWMKDFSRRAVSIWIQQLRDGGRRKMTWAWHGFISLVPFGNEAV